MNYQHAYHAGNFADVFKHIILIDGNEKEAGKVAEKAAKDLLVNENYQEFVVLQVNMFKVYRTEEFNKLLDKLLTKAEKDRVENIEDEISEKGFTGRPLGYNFLREKRINGKRAYFLLQNLPDSFYFARF